MPVIDNRMEQPLPHFIQKVLTTMFAAYSQVIVKSEFSDGFSGSRVFLVRPIREDGRPELPSVVKVDDFDRIEKEWQAYQTCICNRLPNVAAISGDPIYSPGSQKGGLRYPLAGDGAFDVVSLQSYCQQASIDDIGYVLARLFKSMEKLWEQKDVKPDLHLHTVYDSFLPPNLLLEYTVLSPNTPIHYLRPETLHQTPPFAMGETIQLSDFEVVRVLRKSQTLVLDIPSHLTGAYRLQIQSVPDISSYEVGQIIHHPIMGQVKQTRIGALQEQATQALGAGVDVSAVTLHLPNNDSLLNPLTALPTLLNHSFDAYTSCIHADLHLGNVLVEPESGNIHLIDFVNAREDHVLRDFLNLELAIVNRLIPVALDEVGFSPKRIITFYERLHCALIQPKTSSPPPGLENPFAMLLMIRQAAERHLFKSGEWREYYEGLVVYLLGSLRYGDLDKVSGAKQTALWGAAAVLNLLEVGSSCAEFEYSSDVKNHAAATPTANHSGDAYFERGSVKIEGDVVGSSQTKTIFHRPVTGSVHTGSGDINLTQSPNQKEHSINSENETTPHYQDSFSSYEIGMHHLLTQIKKNHPRYLEALGYQDRLRDNISRSRRFGDTNLRQADRAEIIEQLNELSLSVIGISFNELCQGSDKL